MNPYFNSINGWGGGFTAFWPAGGDVFREIPRFALRLVRRAVFRLQG